MTRGPSRRRGPLFALLLFAGCGARPPAEGPPFTAPGVLYTAVPSEAAGDEGVAVRVAYPARGSARYPDGAPVLVEVPGAHSGGQLDPPDAPTSLQVQSGLVMVQLLFPGTDTPQGASGGDFDYRGRRSQQALADVIRYAAGEAPDRDGLLLEDRLPFVRSDLVGLMGRSHGGNAAVLALEAHPDAAALLSWLSTWEAPLGSQHVTVELGHVGASPNAHYVPGSCTLEGCPWAEGAEDLRYDPVARVEVTDPRDGERVGMVGVLCLDLDADRACGEADHLLRGVSGRMTAEEPLRLYLSVYLTDWLARSGLVADWPDHLATPEAARAFWGEREGSRALVPLHLAAPDLPILLLGTQTDHMLAPEDHPHLRLPLDALLASGHGFARMNPDAAYLSALTGISEGALPELPAGSPLPWPGTEGALIPEAVEGVGLDPWVPVAAELELFDRAWSDDWREDLGEPLRPVLRLGP
ncbi:MAG: hypothetical protein JXX28_06480 [Deltaproteobacteria bacterium]|nr:hypothetical protein [Deltaproteobacteria bacterium]